MLSLLIGPLAALPLTTSCGEPSIVDPMAEFVQNAAQQTSEDPEIPKCEGEQIVTPSGIEYCFLAKGEGGKSPKMGDTVVVDYTGWTLDGRSFDSSRRARRPGMQPEPATFTVGGLIDGWNEILQIMVPGDRVLATIPSDLAYGATGSPPNIAPNADLIFDFVLYEVVDEVPRFEAWPAADSEAAASAVKLDAGVELRVLSEGTGEPLAEGQNAVIDWSCWLETGKLAFAHSMLRNPGREPVAQFRAITSTRQPLPFMRSLLPYAKEGARLQVRVPPNMGLRSKFPVQTIPEGSTEIWIVEFPLVDTFKAEFRMPTDEELTTTESGLKYVVLREGTGRAPKTADAVLAHYSGWLTNGNSFDSSHQRAEPSAFGLSQVIPGWTEGLQLMKEGGSAIFVIPAELGYGNRGQRTIPAGSTLVFHVDLLAVQ